MKKSIMFLFAVVMTAFVFAQAPQKLSYQAAIFGANNNLIINQQVGLKISILQGSVSGTVVYSETHTPTTGSNGIASVEIGGGVTTDDFSTINWADGPYFVKTEVDATGGTNYTIVGTSQLLSVPFALHAKHAEHAEQSETVMNENDPLFTTSPAGAISQDDIDNWNAPETDPLFTASPAAGITQDNITQWNTAGSTFDGQYSSLTGKPTKISDFALDANNQRIYNVAQPTAAKDAISKEYLDSRLAYTETLIQELVANSFYLTDSRDGRTYLTAKIGDQIWMRVNLNYKTTNSYYYNNDSLANSLTYGRLYTAAASKTACPTGWRLPNDSEYKVLEMFLGMTQAQADATGFRGTTQGTVMKDASPFWNGTNTSYFSARPGGTRNGAGVYSLLGTQGFYWTTTDSGTSTWARTFTTANATVERQTYLQNFAFSIRCLRN